MPCCSVQDLRFPSKKPPITKFKERVIRYAVYGKVPSTTSVKEDLVKRCGPVFQAHGIGNREYMRLKRDMKKRVSTGSRSHQPVITPDDFKRMQNAAVVHTIEDRLREQKAQMDQTAQHKRETEETRLFYKKIDDEQRAKSIESSTNDSINQGANERVLLLKKSMLARQEQDMDVRQVNHIILEAKCQAIRDSQKQEKSAIERIIRANTLKLEGEYNTLIVGQLHSHDELQDKRVHAKVLYAAAIRKQISDREKLRIMEGERLLDEANAAQKLSEAVRRQEEREVQDRLSRKMKFRADLNRIMEMNGLFKKMLCEQEDEAERRIRQYRREKEARENQLRLEKKIAADEFQQKQKRLFLLAQKMQDSHSQRQHMGYLKEQEQTEREYRKKEKDAALRRKQIEHDLKASLELQLEEAKRQRALRMARAAHENKTIMDFMKQEELKRDKLEEERAQARLCYRKDIISQINNREITRRRLVEYEKKEAATWHADERERKENIRQLILAKVQAMRLACLPERYIKDVERQLQRISVIKEFSNRNS